MISAMPRIAIAMHDFDAAVSLFRDEFGMPVADFSEETVPALGAHVGMCQPRGGSNIELMAPANPEEPLSQALQKFLDRRGDGVYALMLEAPDPNAEAEDLLERGVKVLPLMRGAGGRDIHPSSTHGVLIRVYPDGSVAQPSDPQSAPPGYSGIRRAIVATHDAALAREAYASGLGLEAGEPVADEERGLLTVTVRPPVGGVIELVSPIDSAQEEAAQVTQFLNDRGEGIAALVLGAQDAVDERDITVFGTRLLIE